MKKTMILLSLVLLCMTSVLGLADFNYTDVIKNQGASESSCYYYSGDVYCIGGIFNDTSFGGGGQPVKMYKYDTLTEEFSVINENITMPNSYWSAGYVKCIPYGTKAYCINAPNDHTYSFDADTGNNFLELTDSTDIDSTDFISCDLRPGTDEIVCTTSWLKVLKYDISGDTWEYLSNFVYDNQPYQANEIPSCKFRNNNEFWCFGGDDGLTMLLDDIKVYSINTNTTVTKHMSSVTAMATVLWFNDIAYVFGGNDYVSVVCPGDPICDGNYGIKTINYYNPNTNTAGVLSTEFLDFVGGGTECVGEGATYYCVAGYEDNYNLDIPFVRTITLTELPEPEPTPEVVVEEEDNTNNAFFIQQNIQKEATAKSQPTGILGAIWQVINNIRRALGLQ